MAPDRQTPRPLATLFIPDANALNASITLKENDLPYEVHRTTPTRLPADVGVCSLNPAVRVRRSAAPPGLGLGRGGRTTKRGL